MSQENHNQPQLDWRESIASNISFFRDQSKLLGDAYNPSQIASGTIMTMIIMQHNMLMDRIVTLHQRLETIEKKLDDSFPRRP